MNWTTLRQLAPHYLAMVVLLVVATTVLGIVAPWLDFWGFVAVAVLVGLLYPVAVHLLGVAPEAWQR